MFRQFVSRIMNRIQTVADVQYRSRPQHVGKATRIPLDSEQQKTWLSYSPNWNSNLFSTSSGQICWHSTHEMFTVMCSLIKSFLKIDPVKATLHIRSSMPLPLFYIFRPVWLKFCTGDGHIGVPNCYRFRENRRNASNTVGTSCIQRHSGAAGEQFSSQSCLSLNVTMAQS